MKSKNLDELQERLHEVEKQSSLAVNTIQIRSSSFDGPVSVIFDVYLESDRHEKVNKRCYGEM